MATITEALAEIKTIQKRIQKKREFVKSYLARQEKLKDPLSDSGGSLAAIEKERQAVADLEQRVVDLRRAVYAANVATEVTVNAVTRSIADWLVWRREVAPGHQSFLRDLGSGIASLRKQAQQKGLGVVSGGEKTTTDDDVIVNLDEQKLAEEIEGLEEILGVLDGQLSLKNATVTIDV